MRVGVVGAGLGQWGYPGPFNYSIEVVGSRELVSVDSTEPTPVQLLGGATGASESPDVAVGKSPYQTELEHFLHCITTREGSLAEPRDAYEALRIGLAATEAATTGWPVTLARSR
jgi:UDP-N-acetylglucosamine 3-dehydrogenase